jgi:hypothetical protein
MGKPIRWKVVSSRPYRWGRHRMMKPGQVFTATVEEIPADFMPMIIALDKVPVVPRVAEALPVEVPIIIEGLTTEIPKVVEKPVTYRIKPRGDYFDILDSKGKKINEQKLSEDEALDMLNKLKA